MVVTRSGLNTRPEYNEYPNRNRWLMDIERSQERLEQSTRRLATLRPREVQIVRNQRTGFSQVRIVGVRRQLEQDFQEPQGPQDDPTE